MKKVLAICLALVMLATISVTAFAELGGFVASPSGNQAPELISGTNESEDCEAGLVITAYGKKSELPEETRKKLEEAYDIIVETKDLSKLTAGVKAAADEAGVDVGNLAVSDMFDISATDCGSHEDHGHFDIAIKHEYLENFVCLLHYYNGEWRIVEDAKINDEGHLEFTEKDFSPFAIVVDTGAGSPQTGGNDNHIWIYIAIMVVSATALYFIWKKSKKQRA